MLTLPRVSMTLRRKTCIAPGQTLPRCAGLRTVENTCHSKTVNHHHHQIPDQCLVPWHFRSLPVVSPPRIPRSTPECPFALDRRKICNRQEQMPTRNIVLQHDPDCRPNRVALSHVRHGLDAVQFGLDHVRQHGCCFEIVFIVAFPVRDHASNVGPKTVDVLRVSADDPFLGRR